MPFFKKVPLIAFDDLAKAVKDVDFLLLATPPEVSMAVVLSLKNTSCKIIDLSGAHRLPHDVFAAWYGSTHLCPEQLEGVPYGLSPWSASTVLEKSLIANPGCYATCALMPLIPLLKQDVLDPAHIILDAKSGISGAGKKMAPHLMFCEMANNFLPYKIGAHQHTPEINQAIFKWTNKVSDVFLTTQLLPIERGIAMSIYANAASWFETDEEIYASIHKAFEKAYSDYSLFFHEALTQQKNNSVLLSLKNVVNTPNTQVSYFVKNKKIVIFSCIDNLLKGAASQAIETMNALCQWPITTGLISGGK